jgi:hypothetical protein
LGNTSQVGIRKVDMIKVAVSRQGRHTSTGRRHLRPTTKWSPWMRVAGASVHCRKGWRSLGRFSIGRRFDLVSGFSQRTLQEQPHDLILIH